MQKPAEIVVMNGGARDTGHLRPQSSVLGSTLPPPRQAQSTLYLGQHLEQPWPSVDMDTDPALTLNMDPALFSTQWPQDRDQGLALACRQASSTPSPPSLCLWLHTAQCLHSQE